MVGLAPDEAGLARAAGAALAGARHLAAVRAQRLEYRHAGRHLDRLAGLREAHRERAVRWRLRRRGVDEAFEMHARARPMARHVANRFEQGPWSAAVDVRLRGLLEDRPEVEGEGGIAAVVMDRDVLAEGMSAQLVTEGGTFLGAAEVIEGVTRAPRGLQVPHHREDRRYADSAGDEEDFAGALDQLEAVVRASGGKGVPGAQAVDQAARAPMARGFAFHRDFVAMALGRIVAERVLAQRPVGDVEADVRARGEGGKIAAGGIAQLEEVDVRREPRGPLDAKQEVRMGARHGPGVGISSKNLEV